jgi:4-carboxymuconolactone decarboxylase
MGILLPFNIIGMVFIMSRELGETRIKEILGVNAEQIIKSFEEISPDFANYIVEFAYGDLYARDGLSDKSRELAVVACLIGQGKTGLPLKAHLVGMLNVGWEKQDVIELIIYLIGCVGFPSCVEAISTFKELLDEHN